jgi:hypothetical protein
VTVAAKKIGVRTVIVVRAPKVDRLNPTPTGTPPEHPIEGCAVLPRTSHEEERGWVIVEGRMIIAPYGADVLATDRVKVDGETWDVDGEPGDYENKRGKGKATMFYLKRLGS